MKIQIMAASIILMLSLPFTARSQDIVNHQGWSAIASGGLQTGGNFQLSATIGSLSGNAETGGNAQFIPGFQVYSSLADTQYTLTFQTDGTSGAAISGATTQTVTYGSDSTPVMANAPSYLFIKWTRSGEEFSASNPLTVINVGEDMTLTATFRDIASLIEQLNRLLLGIDTNSTGLDFNGDDIIDIADLIFLLNQ